MYLESTKIRYECSSSDAAIQFSFFIKIIARLYCWKINLFAGDEMKVDKRRVKRVRNKYSLILSDAHQGRAEDQLCVETTVITTTLSCRYIFNEHVKIFESSVKRKSDRHPERAYSPDIAGLSEMKLADVTKKIFFGFEVGCSKNCDQASQEWKRGQWSFQNSSQGQNGNPTQFYEKQKWYSGLCVYNFIRAKCKPRKRRRASLEKRKSYGLRYWESPTPGIKTQAPNLKVISCTTTKHSNQHAGISSSTSIDYTVV